METRRIRFAPAVVAAALLLPLSAGAGNWTVVEDDTWCDERGRDEEWCEVREITLPAREMIAVDAAPNGGISVKAWDRNEIRVLAKISIHDDSKNDAAEIASAIEIGTDEEISAKGPEERGRKDWSVSYRLMVPAKSNLKLESNNGGIAVDGVEGDLALSTNNGGLSLTDVAGDVRGRTTNGGIDVDLGGDAWQGVGLDLETTNGGIELDIPDGYSARLEMATVNGGVHSDFAAGEERARPGRPKRISVTLGDGGALLRLVTTNGGIHVGES
jgi:hypothetical protein